MTYKEFTLSLPHSLNVTVSCCKNEKCIDPQCSHDKNANKIRSDESRRHCINIKNFALYPVIFSADNKIKCGILKFSDNGKSNIVTDDHYWQFTKYIKNGKNCNVNEIDMVPVLTGGEIVETSVAVHVPYNGRNKSEKIELQLKVI